MIYEKNLQESKKLDEQIQSIQAKLKTLPEGKIICSRNGRYYKWYRSDGKRQSYISKKQRHLAEQLALKKYLSLRLQDLIHEKRAIDAYLKNHSMKPGKALQMLASNSEYQKLISPFFKPISQELSDWMNSQYDQNPKYPEMLTQKTSSGHLVRSKSEAMIAHFLFTNQIPFRYECALQISGTTIYPDFTIRHPCTGEIYYWEHFGRMDDKHYSGNAFTKLQLYTSHGIIPSIQLIATYETKENPLNIEIIEKTIENYFL